MQNCEVVPIKLWGEPEKPIPILCLQFSCLTQDEAQSRLSRQIPRYISRKLSLSNKFNSSFFSFKGEINSVECFLNTSTSPTIDIIDEIANNHSTPYVLYGKFGIEDKLKIEIYLYDAKICKIVYKNAIDVYPTYLFDSLDELCSKIVSIAGFILEKEDRMSLFSRDTLNWDAFLYYILAEDDRYAYTIGIKIPSFENTISLYFESLKIDCEFELSEKACIAFITDLYIKEKISYQRTLEYFNECLSLNENSVNINYALMIFHENHNNNQLSSFYANKLLTMNISNIEMLIDINKILTIKN